MSTTPSESAVTIWSPEEVTTIRSVIAPGLNDSEFLFFAQVCRATGLNPLMNQIHAIQRSSREKGPDGKWRDGKKLTIQTSIHGLRLIADRTRCYAPGRSATFETDAGGTLVAATAYVKKFAGGVWHEVSDTAYWDEYAQFKDEYANDQKTGNKIPQALWATKPRVMLAKCAEGLALRRAFPAEMAGLYTDEEMPAQHLAADGPNYQGEQLIGFTDSSLQPIQSRGPVVGGADPRKPEQARPATAEELSGKPPAEPTPAPALTSKPGSGGSKPSDEAFTRFWPATAKLGWAATDVNEASAHIYGVTAQHLTAAQLRDIFGLLAAGQVQRGDDGRYAVALPPAPVGATT